MSNNGHSQTRWIQYHKLLPAPLVAVLLLMATRLGGLYSPVTQPQLAAAETPFTDFNGDGFADLAIGVPQESLGSVGFAGAVNVIYGSSSGLSATKAKADQIWTQNSANIEGFAESFEGFGSSLATGDFNGDAYKDLAIGVPSEDIVFGETNAGAVNVIYGSTNGLSATAVPDQLWTQSSPDIEGTAEEEDDSSISFSDEFGFSIAAGDFNNDGRDDLAVGVPTENLFDINDNIFVDAGAVNVIYGSSSGLSATAKADQLWHQNSSSVEDTIENGDIFGASLASG